MKTTLDLIRAQQALATAQKAATKAKQSSDQERLACAFDPILQIWDDVKEMPSKHFRWYNKTIVPFAEHLSSGSSDSSLYFYGGDGNTGFGVHACLNADGSIRFDVTAGYARQCRTVTLQEAIDSLVSHIATYLILPENV